jgi:hypothetical protein
VKATFIYKHESPIYYDLYIKVFNSYILKSFEAGK